MIGLLKKLRQNNWHIIAILLMAWDFVAIHAAYFLALWFRFDCKYSAIYPSHLEQYFCSITIYAVLTIFIFWIFRLYRSVWRYASVNELLKCVIASSLASVLYALARLFYFMDMPRSYHVFGWIIQLVLIIGIRFSYRVLVTILDYQRANKTVEGRVMIIGAGAAGQMLQRDLVQSTETNDKAVCFIDDDPAKKGRYLDGVPIVGGREEILSAVQKYKIDKIFFAIPSTNAQNKRDILNICSETGCKLMQLPGMYQFVLGQLSISAMKDVSVEDLLGREPIQADMQEVYEYINDKVVLVTGGGGSIGSELCRQIAAHNPRQLIIFDVYENNLRSMQTLVD